MPGKFVFSIFEKLGGATGTLYSVRREFGFEFVISCCYTFVVRVSALGEARIFWEVMALFGK